MTNQCFPASLVLSIAGAEISTVNEAVSPAFAIPDSVTPWKCRTTTFRRYHLSKALTLTTTFPSSPTLILAVPVDITPVTTPLEPSTVAIEVSFDTSCQCTSPETSTTELVKPPTPLLNLVDAWILAVAIRCSEQPTSNSGWSSAMYIGPRVSVEAVIVSGTVGTYTRKRSVVETLSTEITILRSFEPVFVASNTTPQSASSTAAPTGPHPAQAHVRSGAMRRVTPYA